VFGSFQSGKHVGFAIICYSTGHLSQLFCAAHLTSEEQVVAEASATGQAVGLAADVASTVAKQGS